MSELLPGRFESSEFTKGWWVRPGCSMSSAVEQG